MCAPTSRQNMEMSHRNENLSLGCKGVSRCQRRWSVHYHAAVVLSLQAISIAHRQQIENL